MIPRSNKRAATLGDELARRGLNLEQTSVLAGVRPSTVSRILTGKSRATPRTVVTLAKALGVSAVRMRAMADRHYFDEHPDEDPGLARVESAG